MRILRLCLHNLNSLTGTWEIDFTVPAFADGIFSITGPTGAGKTTILDALCLALYGCTPRLGKITQAGNEIMARQTGSCFAEVDISTAKGRYRCSWHQQRRGKKADGPLQSPKRELSQLTVQGSRGTILAERIREVEALVEEITGMDFQRFTRSMLLAQGGFAAFLQASADERSPILEQITGSGLYSEISKAVHQRFKEERVEREQLQQRTEALHLMNATEEEGLRQEVLHLHEEEQDLSRRDQQVQASLAWLESLLRLRRDMTDLDQQQELLAQEEQDFVAEGQRLALALRAASLTGEQAQRVTLRQEQEVDQRAASSLQHKQAELAGRLEEASTTHDQKSKLLEEQKVSWAEGQQLLRQVRDRDLRIQEKTGLLTEAKKEYAGLEQQQQVDIQRVQQVTEESEEKKEYLRQSHIYAQEHGQDESLSSSLTGIQQNLAGWGSLKAKEQQKQQAQEQAQERVQQSLKLWQDCLKGSKEAEQEQQDCQRQKTEAEAALNRLLNMRRVEDIRHEQGLLDRCLDLLQHQEELHKDINTVTEQYQQAQGKDAELKAQRLVLQQQWENIQKDVESQSRLAALASRIRDFEQERQRLEDGQACPLCGAKEHPYAQGNIPILDEVEQKFQELQGKARKVQQALRTTEVEAARKEEQVAQLAQRLHEQTAALAAQQQQVQHWTRQISALEPQASVVAERSRHNYRLLEQVEEGQQRVQGLSTDLEKKLQARLQAEQEQQQAAHERDKAEQEQQRLREEYQRLSEEVQEFEAKTLAALQPYGVLALPEDKKGLAVLDQELSRRRDQWMQQQEEQRSLSQQLSVLAAQLQEIQTQRSSRADQLKEKAGRIHAQEIVVTQLRQERQQLFGERDPEQVEKTLSRGLQAAEAAFLSSRKHYETLIQERERIQAALEEKEAALKRRQEQVEAVELLFLQGLQEKNFADEAAWQAAQLSEEERTALQHRAEALKTRRTRLEQQRQDRQQRLREEEERQLTTEDKESLRTEQVRLAERLRRIREQIGSLEQKLRDNQERRQHQQKLLEDLEAQNREYLRWKLLHDLIGSADGKKYRNFAQGLTFEHLLAHANQQLARMSDRYRLIRDHEQPLEINVVDAWQAGEIRSTKNLSGGESFVVSLALALGLANMVGGTVRLDSLFLDEGFGVLDEEALETALDTLAGLHQEGKLIGVISHVTALKERISCRIEVIPTSGGRSVLHGPGVRHSRIS